MTGFLGAGVSYRRQHRIDLLKPGAGPDVLEVMPEHFHANPAALDDLAERYPLIFHSVSLSIGTAVDDPAGDAVTAAHLGRLRALIRRAPPLFVSDHLAFTRTPGGIDLGHLAPLPYTESTLALVAARVRVWQDALGVPIALENIAHPFRWPVDTMTPAAFFHRLTADTGCGLLLDVTNAIYDARNFGGTIAGATSDGTVASALGAYPLHHVWGLHLAGGVAGEDRFWADTHDQPVDDDAYRALPFLRGCSSLRAAVVERDRRVPDLALLLAEARRAAAVLRETP